MTTLSIESQFIQIATLCDNDELLRQFNQFNSYPIPMHPIDARIKQHIEDEIEMRQMEGRL